MILIICDSYVKGHYMWLRKRRYKKRAIIVKILDNYVGITRLANVQVAILPGPLISKLLIGHKCKIRVRTSTRSACGSTVGVLCGQLVNRYELHIDWVISTRLYMKRDWLILFDGRFLNATSDLAVFQYKLLISRLCFKRINFFFCKGNISINYEDISIPKISFPIFSK